MVEGLGLQLGFRVRVRVGELTAVRLQDQCSEHLHLQHLVRWSNGAKTKRQGIPGMFEKQQVFCLLTND